MTKVKDIVNFLLDKYPLSLCEDFDKGKVGLQFGDMNAEVKKVLITLDSTSVVIDEAIANNCTMLISHHPFMFSPMLNMDYASSFGEKMLKVFKNSLNVFAMHTNFDTQTGGMNDILSEKIGMKNVFSIPEIPEVGSFIRYGEIEEMSLKDFALKVKESLNEEQVRVVGDLNKPIKKVGILGGGGSFAWNDAYRSHQADVYISGEFRHNNGIDAEEVGFSLIEVSHYVESVFKESVYNMLKDNFKDVEFIISKVDHNPFKTL